MKLGYSAHGSQDQGMQVDPTDVDVIAPNLKQRYSGVSSTVFRLVPLQAQKIAIATTGPVLPDDIPQFPLSKLPFLPRSGPSGPRIWHSRRNIEMLVGVVLKVLFRKRLKLVFTSAAQRRRYVAPQRWEGFGLTPLEAMSCGVPVVATRAGAFEDLVVPGETGFLVPIEDLAELTNATNTLMKDAALRQSMAEASRKKVLEHHQIEQEADAINAVYESLLANG